MTVTVRVEQVGDAAAVRRITDDAFAPLRRVYRPSPEQLAHVATVALERLVAVRADELVGTVRYRVDGDLLRLVGLAVAPSEQRRGVARALVAHLTVIAHARGCRALALFTIEQTGNVTLFERLGFEVIAKERDLLSISTSGEELVEVYLERSLEPS
jgi:predicted N-acetyltransferase YhbS